MSQNMPKVGSEENNSGKGFSNHHHYDARKIKPLELEVKCPVKNIKRSEFRLQTNNAKKVAEQLANQVLCLKNSDLVVIKLPRTNEESKWKQILLQ